MTRQDPPLTVTVTCKVWPDKPNEVPIDVVLSVALEEVIDERRGESFVIDVQESSE